MGSTRERNPSLWVGTSSATDHPASVGDRRADVVVVGAGIAGLTTARLLVGSGRSVVVIDAGELAAGTTGYTTAKVTSLQSTIYSRLSSRWGDERAAVYASANQAAITTVRELAADDGIDCGLEEASSYTYTETDAELASIEAEVAAAQRAGLAVTFTTETDLPYAIRGAVRLDGQAQFHPRRYCLGLADAIVRAGGAVHEHTRALEVHKDGRVTTDRGELNAELVVLATHIPISDVGAHFARMEPMRSYAGAFHIEGERPSGMYISIDQPTRSIRSTADGYVVVGGEGHKVGHDADTSRRYDALQGWAAERFGAPAFDYRWSAQDYQSADDLPFIGRLTPGSDRVLVATGFGKWGMTNGTVAAMLISDLADGVDNPWAATFDSTRGALRQGGKKLVQMNLDVAQRFVGDRLAHLRPPDIETLAPGEGGIVAQDGHTVAAFRDEDGELHCRSAKCTHLGCQVSFNTAERTWDCPCHGSRFDVDGQVLQGPAVEDLADRGAPAGPSTQGDSAR